MTRHIPTRAAMSCWSQWPTQRPWKRKHKPGEVEATRQCHAWRDAEEQRRHQGDSCAKCARNPFPGP